MAFDAGLAERIRELLQGRPGVAEKRMFGGLAFMQGGYMCVGIQGETLMARVGPAQHAAALREPHCRDMDFTGRPMKGYVYVDPPGFETDAALRRWVDRCCLFVQSLPPR